MRKFVIGAAIAASALFAAAPAAAQYYPQPSGYGYGHYGHWGHVRQLQARVNQLQRQISWLDNRDILSEREARYLRGESRDLERRLYRSARNGLSGREAYSVHARIQRLEYRIQREARDGNRWRRW